MTTPIEVDGAIGEGGGQVLRSALSLSLLTGQCFRLSRIRANRDRPGLRPQHLAAVQAAARVSGAEVRGDGVGSEEIELALGPVRSGDYFFDIGTAGATTLVLQTLPLALAPGTSSVAIRGGTHVPRSPCFHYLDWQWRPFLARIGVPFDLTMAMAGFYPQGGGELQARMPGCSRPMPVRLIERGPLRAVRGLSAVANLPRDLEDDLEHLFRSLRKDPPCPMITPARCRKCGFRFDDHKLHKPSKCPRCKGTWISEPLISLVEKR